MKVLLTRPESCEYLGVERKLFNQLGLKYTIIGKRKKYHIDTLNEYIGKNTYKDGKKCPLKREKARPTIGMTFQSGVSAFAEAVKQETGKPPKESKRSTETMPYLAATLEPSHV